MIRALVLFMLASQAWAATITATSCSVAHVDAAIISSSDGDTVVIPNGSCTWASGITASVKQITLKGATVGGVTITHSAGGANLLAFTVGNAFPTVIANIRFMPGTGSNPANYIRLDSSYIGDEKVPLMHDMYFNLPNSQLARAVEWFVTGGVIWNTTFESTQNLGGGCGGSGVDFVGSDSGSLGVRSGIAWDDASTMGTADTGGTHNLYIEDSVFSNVGQMPDIDEKGRVVIRHNTIDGSSGLNHGTTGFVGARHVEYYDNTVTHSIPNRPLGRYFWMRGGTGVFTGNSFQELGTGGCYSSDVSIVAAVESAQRDGFHGCCTGYMCYHQSGSGSDGTGGHSNLHASQSPPDAYQISEPVYIWGNTGGGSASGKILGLNDGDPTCSPGTFHTSDFFVSGRDYFLDAGAKPGWTRYTYPHPMRGGSSNTATAISCE